MMTPRVMSVRYTGDYRLELTFTDDLVAEVDFKSRVLGRGGVFRPLADLEFFRQVRLDSEAGTIAWPNGVDFCPDVLYGLATAAPIPVLT